MNEVEVGKIETAKLGWDDVEGHEIERRALEVSLAGSHPIAFICNNHSCAGALVAAIAEAAEAQDWAFHAMTHPTCPCGNYGDFQIECRCKTKGIEKHLAKLTKRRGDFHIWLESIHKPMSKRHPSDSIENVIKRVQDAEFRKEPENFASDVEDFVRMFAKEFGATQLDIKVARCVAQTIARLDGRDEVQTPHIAEAVQYPFHSCRAVRDFMVPEVTEVEVKV